MMLRCVLNLILLVVLICSHEISSDDPQQELQSKTRPTNPVTFSKDFSSLRHVNENTNNEEKFYQKISQQLQSHRENPDSMVTGQSQTSVQSKSTGSEIKAAEKSSKSRPHQHPIHLLVPTKKTKNSKTNTHLPHHKAINHSRPATRNISPTAKPADKTNIPHNRFQRDTLVERHPPRHKRRLGPKNDDKGSFHFRLIVGKNNTARRAAPKLKKLKHPVNLHVLRKRAAIESAGLKQNRNLDTEKKIYLEHNEILDEDFDSFAKDKWSNELVKDKLNFYEKKFQNGSLGKSDESGNDGKKKESQIDEKILQNGIDFATNSTQNVDQSDKEKCENPQIFYRYYWCRAKNVFRNFMKLFKSK